MEAIIFNIEIVHKANTLIAPWFFLFQCVLRLMTETQKENIFYFFSFLGNNDDDKKLQKTTKVPSFTSAQRIFFSILYSIFLVPATGLNSVASQ